MRWRGCVGGAAFLASMFAASPGRGALDADSLFSHAKEAWRARTEAPFVSYAVRARYGFHNHTYDDWFQLVYRASDGALSVHPILIPGETDRKERGVPVYLFGLKIFDTNPDADPITMREPAIAPAFTFGLVPHAFLPFVPPAPGDPTPEPEQARLREIGRVIASNREYRVIFKGVDRLRYGEAYHLGLEPLRDPEVNRLRDVWIAKDSYLLMRERVAGIFDSRPYDRASWTVEFVPVDGRTYIQQVRTDDDLHFGIERIAHMQLDFVDYRFPADVPAYTFERGFSP